MSSQMDIGKSAASPLGVFDLDWLQISESVVDVLRKKLWAQVEEVARKEILDGLEGDEKDRANKSVTAMLSIQGAKEYHNRALAHSCFRACYGTGFTKVCTEHINEFVTYSPSHFKWVRFGLTALSNKLHYLRVAANGTFFSSIPLVVYVSLFYCFAKVPESLSVKWWTDGHNRVTFKRLCEQFFPGPKSNRIRERILAGAYIMLAVIKLLFGDLEVNADVREVGEELADAVHEFKTEFGNGPNEDSESVTYYKSEEEERMLKLLKILSKSEGATVEATAKLSMNVLKFKELHERSRAKNNSLLIKKLSVLGYRSSNGFLCSAVPLHLLGSAVPVWKAISTISKEIECSSEILKAMKELRKLSGASLVVRAYFLLTLRSIENSCDSDFY